MLDAASPLAGLETPPAATEVGVTLRELSGLAATMLRGGEGEGLPGPGGALELAWGTALWAAPGQWLLLHASGTVPPFPAARLTPLHGARCVLEVAGPRAAEALATLLPIDLGPRAFGPQAAAATVAAHVPVTVWRSGEAFRVSCYRSFALSLAEALLAAGRGRGVRFLR
ncbi:MAG: hypothetical protein K2X11_11875 [Acetobacteraceae bacterium]|nr:hypothetical protein [Acetobacteraceae bacterium]